MQTAKYTQGSITRHLVVMAGSAAAGLMAMFLSDLIDMYFLGLLGEVEIAAAVGYAGSIMFFMISLNIGLMVACSALVSKTIGSGDHAAAREAVTHSCISALIVAIPITIVTWLLAPTLLTLLGAEGDAFKFAKQYVAIIIPSMPLLALAMSSGGVMRARGDAKGAMWVTLIGGIVNVILDPIFIFALGWGIQGAAVASVLSRVAMLGFGIYVVVYKNRLFGQFVLSNYLQRYFEYFKVAIPAVLTNLSTPIAVAYMTYVMAQFGDSAVAGNAIISRIQPVAFAGLFALSGVVGPIAGQNYGARKMDRVYVTLKESTRLVLIYCAVVCALLWLIKPVLVPLFNASEEANKLVYLFCNGVSLMFIFNGFTFVTNALFNNLGVAHYSTVLNFLKATVGTIPFVTVGVWLGGIEGAFWGLFIGSAVMGIIGLLVAVRLIRSLSERVGE